MIRVAIELPHPIPPREALRRILRALLGQIESGEAGVREDRDIEHLHDFRVAIRRVRALLGAFADTEPGGTLQELGDGFAWLGDVTGPVRDLDVQIARLARDALVLEVEPAAVDPLARILAEDRQDGHDQLIAALDSRRYRELVDRTKTFVTSWDAGESERDPGGETAAGWSVRQIRQAWKKFSRKARKAIRSGTDENLHRLRIRAKRLRYLLEFFRSYHPAGSIEPTVSALRKLQDGLGAIQDSVVHRRRVASLIEALTGRPAPHRGSARSGAGAGAGAADPDRTGPDGGVLPPPVPVETFVIAGRILQHLHHIQLEFRSRAPELVTGVLDQRPRIEELR